MSNVDVRSSDCLLVIDVQNDFCKGGHLAVPDGDEVVDVINKLLPLYQHVVLSQDWHPEGHSSFASQHPGQAPLSVVDFPYGPQTLWPDHCIQGSYGAEFHPRLNTDAAHLIVRKGFRKSIDSYSAFFENDHTSSTGLSGYLQNLGVERVVCVGLATDFCVRFSAEDSHKAGFETVVLTKGCRGIDIDGSVAKALSALSGMGITVV
jgi:nicotinamidase/pyrazinamidase